MPIRGKPLAMSQDHLQTLMMLAGLGLLCWLLMRGKMRQRRQLGTSMSFSLGHNANAQAQVGPFTGTKSLGAPADVLKWQVELHELGRELKGELDSKMMAVRSLVTNYDRAARRLAELIRMAEQVQMHVDSEPQASVSQSAARSLSASPLDQVRQLGGLGWSPERIAHATSLSESEVHQLLTLTELHKA